MITKEVPRFVLSRPFEPFSVFLAGGREVQVHRPDHVAIGEHVLTLSVVHPSDQVEIIDVNSIVSICTLRGVKFAPYLR